MVAVLLSLRLVKQPSTRPVRKHPTSSWRECTLQGWVGQHRRLLVDGTFQILCNLDELPSFYWQVETFPTITGCCLLLYASWALVTRALCLPLSYLLVYPAFRYEALTFSAGPNWFCLTSTTQALWSLFVWWIFFQPFRFKLLLPLRCSCYISI